jgi:hypothetical protein
MATQQRPTYYRGGPTLKSSMTWLVAIGAAIGALGTIAGTAKAYLDRHYVPSPTFALYVHDDSLRHQFAQRDRTHTAFLIDSIEKAHQHPRGDRVLQAGDPR